MGLNGRFACCGICGTLGHKTRSCPLYRLEERKSGTSPDDRPAPARKPVEQLLGSVLLSGPGRL